jgi:hypothetical protein
VQYANKHNIFNQGGVTGFFLYILVFFNHILRNGFGQFFLLLNLTLFSHVSPFDVSNKVVASCALVQLSAPTFLTLWSLVTLCVLAQLIYKSRKVARFRKKIDRFISQILVKIPRWKKIP